MAAAVASSVVYDVSTNPYIAAKPAGTVAGDLLVAFYMTTSSPTGTGVPAGWTQIIASGALNIRAFRADGGVTDMSFPAAGQSSMILLRITGATTTGVLSSITATLNGAAPSVSPAGPGLLLTAAESVTAIPDPPAGMTMEQTRIRAGSVNSAVASQRRTAAGATGTRAFPSAPDRTINVFIPDAPVTPPAAAYNAAQFLPFL